MSVFKGNILEYSGVIVDRFNASNCRRGRVFFLSHCHKDHMSGLDSEDLLKALKERKINLYCSEVTNSLLSNDPGFTHLTPYMRPLPVEEPVNLQLESFRNEDSFMVITVTLIPAGHCPGSVMFLFQGEVGNVLYTGDFRLSVDDVKTFRSLHTETGKVIELKTLYLDTTFCHPKSENIISRDETRNVINKKAKEWLAQSSDNVVHLDCRSFGYEHIFLSLASELKTKIHIAQWRKKSYAIIPSVSDCLTEDANSTRIHACSYKKGHFTNGLPCGAFSTAKTPVNVLHIKPSAQWFLTNSKTEHYEFIPQCNLFRVLHSMHASYSELVKFVSYLCPTSIVPCVIPASLGDTSLVDLHERLRSLLPVQSQATPSFPQLSEKSVKPRPIKRASGSSRKWAESNSDYETDDELINDDVLLPQVSPAPSNKSFDFSLPALSSSCHQQQATDQVKNQCVQPDLSLSFNFEDDQTFSPSPKRKKTNHKTTPTKTTPTKNAEENFIDLTQSSDDTHNSCHDDCTRPPGSRTTPDSVITISDTVSPVELVLLTGSSSNSAGSHETTPPPIAILRNRSPSVLPLSPHQEKADSILSRRNLNFM